MITFYEGLAVRGSLVSEIMALCFQHGLQFHHVATGGWLVKHYVGKITGPAQVVEKVGRHLSKVFETTHESEAT